MVLSLLLLTHVLCVRGTFALFNNLWDPNNAIHVRKFSFGTCATVFACVETCGAGCGMTICIDVGQRPVGFIHTVLLKYRHKSTSYVYL